MSADSHQKRTPTTSASSGAARLVPNVVAPQAVSDRSVIDSVAGFINDVALTNVPQTDPRDQILWVKFENLADISDPLLGDDWDLEGNLPPPLLIIIGYGNGIQVWAVPANGEAIEVMSWRNGAVKTLRILPTPFLSNNGELANDLLDQFMHKRPLMAICGDSQLTNVPTNQQMNQNQQFNAVNFVSLKDGDQVKSIRFKSPIIDVLANRTSIVITFPERIAVFDARTLEDRLTVTTCYPCPGGYCPVALGDRWIAYAEKRLIPSKRSSGGCDFDGVSSYTATVLNAAKSLGKGLRELGEHVAAGLTGSGVNSSNLGSSSSSSGLANADGSQPGVITILDIKHQIKDISPTTGTPVAVNGNDPIVAHFLAHSDAIQAISFDPSGMLLVTADRRGHDFNVFRVQTHPCGSALASIHHLYVLHRGDTSAKVQDIAFSFDSRWVAISSLRGTTHVFPITPYGGVVSYRTHGSPHVVNRLSRFHRSAGLSIDGRSSSPILMAEHSNNVVTAYTNPRLPPFPHPTVVLPLAQLRQPTNLGSTTNNSTQQGSKQHNHQRQRLSSMSEDQSHPLRVAAVFAKSRSWLLDPPGVVRESTVTRVNRRSVDSLFVMGGHGALIQYDLEPRYASNIPKEKACDDTPIELLVEARAQWILGHRSITHTDLAPPLPSDNWLIKDRLIDNNLNMDSYNQTEPVISAHERWLSQVEILTHAGPHRRLWMGPQFTFKTYNTPSGHSLTHIDAESVEISGVAITAVHSTPMNIISSSTRLFESGSSSSHEQSPRFLEAFRYEESEVVLGPDSQLREDLADAMRESPLVPTAYSKDSGHGYPSSPNNASNLSIDYNIPNNVSYVPTVGDGTTAPAPSRTVIVSIAKMVNPQGTVTTITSDNSNMIESYSSDRYIHENCDESMFRPVVTVIGSSQRDNPVIINPEDIARPVDMPSQLIVPVIDERALLQKQKDREEHQRVLKLQADQKKLDEVKKELEKEAKLEEIMAMNKKGKKGAKNMKKEKSPPVEKSMPVIEKPQKAVVVEKEVEIIDPEPIAQKLPEKVIVVKVIPKVQVEENAQKSQESMMPKSFSELMKEEALQNLEDEVFVEKVEIKKEFKSSKSLAKETPIVVEQKLEVVEIKLPEPEVKQEEFIKPETKPYKNKKDKDVYKKKDKYKQQQQVEVKPKEAEKVMVLPTPEIGMFDDFSPLGELTDIELPPPPLEDHHDIDYDAIMKVSKHETIGDDDIEIIPHQNSVEIKDSPEKSPEIEIIEMPTQESPGKNKKVGRKLIKNEDFYDLELNLDDLPALEPLAPLEALETFDTTFESLCFKENGDLPADLDKKAEECSMNLDCLEQSDDEYQQKQDMKKKMSEMLNNTNMVFAMCSSLKELKVEDDGDENRSLTSSQIQTSTSSTTTTTTTTTFATDSVSSNQIGEGLDSDYKSLELEVDENFEEESKLDDEDLPLPQKELVEGPSSFDTNSSDEADDTSSSKKSTISKMNCNDDEETRPLITSVSSELSPSPVVAMSPVPIEISNIIISEITTAIETPTLPDLNQKTTNNNSSGGNNKRKSKKKKR